VTLRKFVADTLTQIVHGVEDARGSNQKIAPTVVDKNENLKVVPASDVAVVVSKKTDSKAGGSVAIYVLDADASRTTSDEHSTTSRIKFQVPITFDDYADVS
jgi:hypothetical protein